MANQRENFFATSLVPRFSVGLEQREADLHQLLSDPTAGVSVAGVTGMSGMGKSALASLVFQTRRAGYEKASFLENVRGRSTEDVQRQLLVDLCGTVDWDKSKYAGKIRQMVGTLRVLVVVDDVGCDEELAALQLSAFREERAVKKKSKAVVTGQDWQVMQDYVSTRGRVQLEPLDEMDSMALFSHYAYAPNMTQADKERQRFLHQVMAKDGYSHKRVEHTPKVDKLSHDFEIASIAIVDACGGNPLSLQMVGEFLGKKKVLFGNIDLLEMYKEALYKLNHAQALGGSKRNDRLWTRLWDRFHDLDRPEQDMFVELASFLDEEQAVSSDRARSAGTPTASREALLKRSNKSGSPSISLENLIDKSFVAVQPGGRILSMHNHFRAMARKIAAERAEECTARSEKLRLD